MNTVKEFRKFVESKEFSILYFYGDNCQVCKTIRPKFNEMLDNYPEIENKMVKLEFYMDASAEFNVFTIPTIIGFVNGMEAFRFSRFVSMDELEEKVERNYNMIFA